MNLPNVDINRLPSIIAGPILRRVEKDLVSVWLALKNAQYVTLRVYPKMPGFEGSGGGTGGRPKAVLVGSRDTVNVGASLHIVCVSALTDDPAHMLEPSHIYFYDITLSSHGSTAVGSEYQNNLNAYELLQDHVIERPGEPREVLRYALGYAEGILPSFSLPPTDLKFLRIFHGSCRKPHAPGKDALAALDQIVKTSRDSANNRPHHLFLHGDQIYADDVSTPLLPYLTAWGNALLGWTEAEMVPGIGGKSFPITDKRFVPTKRKDIVGERRLVQETEIVGYAGFTSKHCDNHLISLGEYYAMYLFVLSQELFLASDYWLSPEHVLGNDVVSLAESVFAAFMIPKEAADARELVRTYKKEQINTQSFVTLLPNVRRVLANVPTYMVFDDHEVTDDWYLNEEWARDKLRTDNLLARRIMTNALIAYSIFQAWGNMPADYESGAGADFLHTVQLWHGDNTNHFDTLASLVGVVDFGVTPAQRLFFDYTIVYSGVTQSGANYATHRILALDTRTWRLFDNSDAAGLIRPDMLQRQVINPIGGVPEVDVTIVISPVPVLGIAIMEEIVQPMLKQLPFFGGMEFADYEAWSFHRKTFQDILGALGSVPRVVILSGDVHYGFSSVCEYWKSTSVQGSVFAQLTASSLKNQESLTEMLHKGGYDPLSPYIVLTPPGYRIFHIWENLNRDLRLKIDAHPTNNYGPAYVYSVGWQQQEKDLVVLETTIELLLREANRNSDSCFRLYFIGDTRPILPGSGGVVDQVPYYERLPSGGSRAVLGSYKRVGTFLSEFLNEKGAGRQIVGLNNLGEVTFDTDPDYKLYHRLWWALPNLGVHPYTQYEISLSPSGPRPTVPI